MVEFLSDIRPDLFVRRSGNFSDIAGNPFRTAQGDGRDAAGARRGPFAGLPPSAVELSDGARQALRGSERALELARDFNASRLGRPARRRLGEFFRGLTRELGASERDVDRTARRIGQLTEDLDRRFGDLAQRILGRLDSGFGTSLRSTEFSLSQISFSLQVDTTILSVVKDGEASLLRLDQVQLSLQATQIEGSLSVSEGFGFAPGTPLFELGERETATDIVDRLIGLFGTSTVTSRIEAQELELDLSTTVFSTQGAGLSPDEGEEGPDLPEPEGGVSLVA